MSRIPVAIVGATGLAGQQFLASLAGHPLFEIRKLAASSRSAGKKYAQAVRDDKGKRQLVSTGEPEQVFECDDVLVAVARRLAAVIRPGDTLVRLAGDDHVLVLTMHESKELAAAVKRVGAKGYVVKSHAARDLITAIQTIVDGGDFFTPDRAPSAPAKREEKKKSPLLRIGLSPAFAQI